MELKHFANLLIKAPQQVLIGPSTAKASTAAASPSPQCI